VLALKAYQAIGTVDVDEMTLAEKRDDNDSEASR